jgi:hypothetical protein
MRRAERGLKSRVTKGGFLRVHVRVTVDVAKIVERDTDTMGRDTDRKNERQAEVRAGPTQDRNVICMLRKKKPATVR